jgi:HAE1 family hydrophobic/amphiphilic exporter-1
MPAFEAPASDSDIGHAVLATTLSLAVIFIPVSFMSSIAGRFLYQFGITAAAAVMVSLLVSFTLTPMMCARMLHVSGKDQGSHDAAHSRQGFYRWIDSSYMASLRFSMKYRVLSHWESQGSAPPYPCTPDPQDTFRQMSTTDSSKFAPQRRKASALSRWTT